MMICEQIRCVNDCGGRWIPHLPCRVHNLAFGLAEPQMTLNARGKEGGSRNNESCVCILRA